MKIKSRKLGFFSGLILGAALLMSMAVADNAGATDTPLMPDFEGSSGLTISYTYDNEKIKLDGAEISIYKVADASVRLGEVTYTLDEYYKKQLPEDFKIEDMTEESSVSVAKTLKTDDIKADSVTVTDDDGNAVFKNLVPGIYLVSQTGKNGTAADYELFGNFLISVPEVSKTEAYNATKSEYEDQTEKERYEKIGFTGKWNYKVFVYPKTETTKIPTPPGTPKTGDENNIFILVIIGIAAGVAGYVISRKRN